MTVLVTSGEPSSQSFAFPESVLLQPYRDEGRCAPQHLPAQTWARVGVGSQFGIGALRSCPCCWGLPRSSLRLQAPRLDSICSEIPGPSKPSAFPKASCRSRESYLKGKGDPRPRRLPAQHRGRGDVRTQPHPSEPPHTRPRSSGLSPRRWDGWRVVGRAGDAGKGERRGSGAD